MKFRSGFVTNSSSSSYVCEICGDCEGGYDMSLEDAEMYECENGHTFCRSHVFNSKKYYINALKYIAKNENKYPGAQLKALVLIPEAEHNNVKMEILDIMNISDRNLDDYDYDYPAALCPICNKSYIDDSEILNYVSEKFGFKVEDIKREILDNFYNY